MSGKAVHLVGALMHRVIVCALGTEFQDVVDDLTDISGTTPYFHYFRETTGIINKLRVFEYWMGCFTSRFGAFEATLRKHN